MSLVERGVVPVAGILRSARAVADLSQRELAERSGVTKSRIARMERDKTGATTSVLAFAQALTACGLSIDATANGLTLQPDDDESRDRGGRRFPPHLDPRPVHRREDWWGLRTLGGWDPRINGYTPVRSFNVSRELRDIRRSNQANAWDVGRWVEHAHLVPPCHVRDGVAFRIAYGRTLPDSDTPSFVEGPQDTERRHPFARFFPWDEIDPRMD